MKTLAFVLCGVLALGLVFAGGDTGNAKMPGKSHKMTVEIVSVDMDAKTITIKDEKGENHTAPVMGKALETLKTVKVGEKVVVTCQDNEQGEHQGVVKISMPKAATHTSK